MADYMTRDTNLALMRAAQIEALARAQDAARAAKTPNAKQIDEQAKDFEAAFLSEMIKPMFETVKVNSLFGGGKGEEVFRGMMIQEYGKKIAAAGGIGLAEKIRSELLRIQEEGQKK